MTFGPNSALAAASAVEIALGGSGEASKAPSQILLIPAGEVRARPHDGRAPWVNRDAGAVVEATRALKAPIAIDYEHQSQRSARNGKPAPAAGWINRTFVRDGAVWGDVEWTEKARAHIEAREYRFISPVFRHTPDTREVTRIEGAALVNDPALYMSAIAGAGNGEDTTDDRHEDSHEEDPMTGGKDTTDKAALAKALGLDADADGTSVLAAATAAAKGATALGRIAKALGLDETADASAIEQAVAEKTATAVADTPDPRDWVPRAEFDRVAKRLEKVETARAEEAAQTAVDAACAAGKVAPAQGDWALAYARKDPDGFAAYVEAAPAIVTPGRVLNGAPQPATTASAGITLPAGRMADPERMGLHERALARAQKDNIDYAEAAALEDGLV